MKTRKKIKKKSSKSPNFPEGNPITILNLILKLLLNRASFLKMKK